MSVEHRETGALRTCRTPTPPGVRVALSLWREKALIRKPSQGRGLSLSKNLQIRWPEALSIEFFDTFFQHRAPGWQDRPVTLLIS
jgi:hypothetical protein